MSDLIKRGYRKVRSVYFSAVGASAAFPTTGNKISFPRGGRVIGLLGAGSSGADVRFTFQVRITTDRGGLSDLFTITDDTSPQVLASLVLGTPERPVWIGDEDPITGQRSGHQVQTGEQWTIDGKNLLGAAQDINIGVLVEEPVA